MIQRRTREHSKTNGRAPRQVMELRQVVAEQARILETILAKMDTFSKREDNLRTEFHEAREWLGHRQDEIQAALYNFQGHLAALQEHLSNSGPADRRSHSDKDSAYRQLVHRIREVVRTHLPREARVIVVSKGDLELIDLYGRVAWHFPQNMDGTYAGYYPADSGAAIAHLEALRSKGGDFLLFPNTARWWLEHYTRFRQHLERRYRVVVRQEETCVIFALREPASLGKAAWWAEFAEVIADYQSRFARDPAILDWKSGLELAARFPQCTAFSPPADDDVLPYLDQSIDIVAMSSAVPMHVREAYRTAAAAVVMVSPLGNDVKPAPTLDVNWQSDREAVPPPPTSIIIPSYNGIAYTETLLATLRETLPHNFREEIIVVDDASTDDTQDRLKLLAKRDKRIKLLRNRKNAGFIMSCNRGARAASGEIIIFFNNDTLALPGWLSPLLQIFRHYPTAGAVGGKLIYPDGRLQEAGGLVFSDASAANFGKGDYAVDAALYNYVREVDYVTGAFLATKRSLFIESGGFDTRFRPIYYEDTDYCFRLREMGYRVYYQPESAIIHVEGATVGTDRSKGTKRYQDVNRVKFARKWRHALKRQPPRPKRFDLATWYALAVREELNGDENR